MSLLFSLSLGCHLYLCLLSRKVSLWLGIDFSCKLFDGLILLDQYYAVSAFLKNVLVCRRYKLTFGCLMSCSIQKLVHCLGVWNWTGLNLIPCYSSSVFLSNSSLYCISDSHSRPISTSRKDGNSYPSVRSTLNIKRCIFFYLKWFP